MNWSPDGKRFAAYLDTYPASIFIYDAATWKPIAQWRCGEIGAHSEFSFQPYGTLLQLQDDAISALDAGVLKTITN
jgi:hypothetical protein